jgi:hypothetical protein
VTLPESWTYQKPRYNCPVCGVETHRGRTCRYHNRNESKYKKAVLDVRVAHLVSVINECIDKARL